MNAIEIKNLCKSYPGFSLDNLNLILPKGCIMGLIGENGAGKSTTIRLILNMKNPESGTITLLGQDNTDNKRLNKEDIGIVLDEVGITGCLNAKQVGRVMGCSFHNWQPDVYAEYLRRFDIPTDKAFKDYSRGMKMKLGIAVALSHEAKLLILDEPTSGLDPVVRDEIIDIFNDFTRDENHSILISSHIVSDLEKLCDYIAFLHKGKLLLCEEKDVLTEQYGIIHGTAEEIKAISAGAVIGQKETPYGTEAIVKRSAIPYDMEISPVSIEELFVFMVKGVN